MWRVAFCKTFKKAIKNEQYVIDSLNYISSPKKASQVTYVNETVIENDVNTFDVARDYRITRMLNQKNDKILAHHFIQSFSQDDNISPELAYQIGIEFIEKNLSQYQVTLATHIDGNNPHNHFIINSVSPMDGKKFLGNQTTINSLKQASDEICLNYGLSIIEKGSQSKYKGLDRETLECAKQGKSWKVQLVKDLDEAFEKCETKNDFISFMRNKKYEIKYTNKNITFIKEGYSKGIRADTLAKQFGQKYCKASIDYRYENKTQSKVKTDNSTFEKNELSKVEYKRMQLNKFSISQWKRQENIQIKKFRPYSYNKNFTKLIYSKNPFDFTVKLICCLFLSTKTKYPVRTTEKAKIYKIKSYNDFKDKKQFVSNINYKTLVDTPGNTLQLKLYSWQIAKLLDNNILFASKIDLTTGTALITVKDFDIERIAGVLKIPSEQLKAQSRTINNRKVKYEIKQKKEETEYLVITNELYNKLKLYSFSYQHYERKDGKHTIAFSSNDKDKILKVLFPNRQEKNKDSFYYRNVKINRELKAISEETGQKLCYKIVVNSQYAKLKNSDINFAVFKQDDGRYNIVFLQSEKYKLENIIGGGRKARQPTERKNKNLKK